MYGSGILILLLLNFGVTEAIDGGGGLCYVLDGILVVYGIVLTILYCRLRMQSSGNNEKKEEKPDGVYEALKHQNKDIYGILNAKGQASG